jgi:hypothetical protein
MGRRHAAQAGVALLGVGTSITVPRPDKLGVVVVPCEIATARDANVDVHVFVEIAHAASFASWVHRIPCSAPKASSHSIIMLI